jgi:hypothetical protein
LRGVVPGSKVLLFTRKKVSSVEQADPQRPVQKSLQECQYIVVYPDCLAPTFSTMKTQKTQKGALNQQMKEISKWNTPLIGCAAQV